MAINIDHSGQLAGRLPVLGLRTGQLQYQDRRRQEEEARQLALMQLAQRQRQGDQQYALGQQRLSQQDNQFQQGMLGDFARMALGNQFDQQRDMQLHQNRQDLLRQQQEDALSRAQIQNEYYRERDTINFGRELEQQSRANARRFMNSDGRALMDQHDRERSQIMSDPTLTAAQRAKVFEQQFEKEKNVNWEKYRIGEFEPGYEYTSGLTRYRVADDGVTQIPQGLAYGRRGEPKSLQELLNPDLPADQHPRSPDIAKMPDGSLVTGSMDRSGHGRVETISKAPEHAKPLTDKDKVEMKFKEVEMQQKQSAMAQSRLDSFYKLKSLTKKDENLQEVPVYQNDAQIWAMVNQAHGVERNDPYVAEEQFRLMDQDHDRKFPGTIGIDDLLGQRESSPSVRIDDLQQTTKSQRAQMVVDEILKKDSPLTDEEVALLKEAEAELSQKEKKAPSKRSWSLWPKEPVATFW